MVPIRLVVVWLLLGLSALAQAPPRLLQRYDSPKLASFGVRWQDLAGVELSSDGRFLVFVQQAGEQPAQLVRLDLSRGKAQAPLTLPTQEVEFFAASPEATLLVADFGRTALRIKGARIEPLPVSEGSFRFTAPPWVQSDLRGHFWTRGLEQGHVRQDQLWELEGTGFTPRFPLPNPDGVALAPSARWWVWLEDTGEGPVNLRSSVGGVALEASPGFGMPALSDLPGLLAYLRLPERGASEAVVRQGDKVTSLGQGAYTDLAFTPAGDRVVLREGDKVLVARSPDWKLAPLGLPPFQGQAGRLLQSLDGGTLLLLTSEEMLVFRLENANFLP